MPVCRGLISVHPRFVKAVFPRENPGKLLAGYLCSFFYDCFIFQDAIFPECLTGFTLRQAQAGP